MTLSGEWSFAPPPMSDVFAALCSEVLLVAAIKSPR